MRALAALAVVGGIAAVVACAHRQAPLDPALAPLPGAVDVERTDAYQGMVEYRIDDAYPARRTVRALRESMRQRGWREMDIDIFGGTLDTGAEPDWVYSEDALKEPHQKYEWHSQWTDAQGRVAWYVLTYEVIKSTESLTAQGPVRILGTLLSAETVARLKAAQQGGGSRP